VDVAADVAHGVGVAKAAVVEPLDDVVVVEALFGVGAGLDMPGEQRLAQGLGHGVGQLGLSGARLAAHQQGPAQDDGGVDVGQQAIIGDVAAAAREAVHSRHRLMLRPGP